MTAIEPILKKLTDAEVRVLLLLQLGKPGLLAEWERNRQIEYALKRFNEKCSLHDVAVELAAHFGISVQLPTVEQVKHCLTTHGTVRQNPGKWSHVLIRDHYHGIRNPA